GGSADRVRGVVEDVVRVAVQDLDDVEQARRPQDGEVAPAIVAARARASRVCAAGDPESGFPEAPGVAVRARDGTPRLLAGRARQDAREAPAVGIGLPVEDQLAADRDRPRDSADAAGAELLQEQ